MNPTPQDWLAFIDMVAKFLVLIMSAFTTVLGWYVRQIIQSFAQLRKDVAELKEEIAALKMKEVAEVRGDISTLKLQRHFAAKENDTDHKRLAEDSSKANDRIWMELKAIRLDQQHFENLVEAMRNGMEALKTQMAVWQNSIEKKI